MRSLQPLLIGCLWATFLAVNGRETLGSDRLYGSWAACQGPVCNEVQRQAEGLTRLKLLRNYVVQTMQLMDSLVTSLDEELVKTGQGLASFVGHRCEAVHPLLQHVITTNVSPDRLNNANLRDDLDASESSHESEHIRSDDYEDWNNEVQQSSHKSSNVQLEASSSHSISSVSKSSSSSVGGQSSSTNKNIGKQLEKGSGIKRGPYVAPSQPGGREIVSGQGGTGSGFGGGSSGSGGSGSGFGGGSSGGSGSGFGGGSSGGSGSGFGGGSGGSGSGFGGGGSGSGGSGSGFGGGGSGSGGSGSGFGGGGSSSGGSGSGFGGGGSSSGGSGSGFGGGSGGSGSDFGGGGSGSGGSGSGFGGGGGSSSGGSGSGFGGGSGGSGSGFGGGGSSSSGGSGSGFGGDSSSSGKGGSGSGFGGGSVRQCRGVSQGSPHWVPGLDGWCVNNCAAGYCPSTHCVC